MTPKASTNKKVGPLMRQPTVTCNRSGTLLLAGRSDSNQVSVCLASAVSPAYCRRAALPNPLHPLLSKPTSISAHGSVQVLCAECAPKHLSNATRQVHKYINGAFASRPPSVMFCGNGSWCILHTCRHNPWSRHLSGQIGAFAVTWRETRSLTASLAQSRGVSERRALATLAGGTCHQSSRPGGVRGPATAASSAPWRLTRWPGRSSKHTNSVELWFSQCGRHQVQHIHPHIVP